MQQVTLSQREALRDAAKELFNSADSLVTQFERGGRDSTAAENIKLRSQIERAQQLRAKANGAEPDTEATDQRSRLFRAIRYLTLAHGKHLGAEGLARAAHDVEVALVIKATANAASTTNAPWAGVLVSPALGEFIDLLRPRSALFALVPDPLPLIGTVRYPRATGAGSPTGFVAEGTAIPVKAGALEGFDLTPKKAAGICVATGELMRRGDRIAESFAMGTLSGDIAAGVDAVFLSNSAATAAAPAGIFHSDNAVPPLTAAAGGTAAAVAADIAALIAAGANMTAPRLLINPAALSAAAALSGSGDYAIISGLSTGSIGAVQVVTSGSLTLDTIALIDADGLIVAGGDGFELNVSEHATLHMEDTTPATDLGGATNPTPLASMFQRDMVAMLVKLFVTWHSKRKEHVQHITGATWA